MRSSEKVKTTEGFWSREDVFGYLLDLRDEGIVNMWGAPAFLEQDLGMSREDAKNVFLDWVDSFED